MPIAPREFADTLLEEPSDALCAVSKAATVLAWSRGAEAVLKYARGLLESVPDAMVIVNRLGRTVLVNPQTEKLFGYQREELLGQPIEMLVPERFRGVHVGHRTGYFGDPRHRALDKERRFISHCPFPRIVLNGIARRRHKSR